MTLKVITYYNYYGFKKTLYLDWYNKMKVISTYLNRGSNFLIKFTRLTI